MLDWELWQFYGYMEQGQKDLVRVAEALLRREIEEEKKTFYDYSFVVFPMAKAYEGFIKKYVYELGLITKGDYVGEHFRIGKSLNPDLPEKYRRDDWVVGSLNELCGEVKEGQWAGRRLTEVMWEQWRESRNMLFHYFPDRVHFVDLNGAQERLRCLAEVMEAAMRCEAFERGKEE